MDTSREINLLDFGNQSDRVKISYLQIEVNSKWIEILLKEKL